MNKCLKCNYLNELSRATCEECGEEISFKEVESKEWPEAANFDSSTARDRRKWVGPKVKTFEDQSYRRKAVEARVNSWLASGRVRVVSTTSYTRKGAGGEYICIVVTYEELVDITTQNADGCAASLVLLISFAATSFYALLSIIK